MSRFFGENLVEQIRVANDIISVVSEAVTLKKKGKKYWGCCPFHSEKTPSFSVDAEKGMFYCFGCRAGGDVFSYVQKYDNLSFSEAVEKLAQRAQISLPESKRSPASIAQEKQKTKINEVNELATTFFYNCLTKTDLGKQALAYLHDRGLSDDIINKFRLGYAPPGWNRLQSAFNKRGYNDSVLLDAGLCRRNKDKVYDYFRDRVIFPISDGRGTVLGFGGRVMGDEQPKYLNSSETQFFNKGKILFAFNQAYRSIREKKQVILVEGYMDVISAHNNGIYNVVASLGTAFTKQQAQLLMRQADDVVLAYDMDGAGRDAVRRAISIAQELDMNVRVLSIPEGKDPDDFIRKHGASEFLKLVDKAISPFEFILNEALVKHDVTNLQEKIEILNEVLPFVAETRQSVKREGYLRALALPLFLDNSTIFKYFREYERNHKVRVEQNELSQQVNIVEATMESKLVAMALTKPEAINILLAFIPKDEFKTLIYYDLLKKAKEKYMANGGFNLVSLEQALSSEEKQILYSLMALEVDDEMPAFYTLVKKFRLCSLQEKYKKHSMLADRLNRAGDAKFIEEVKQCQEIQDEIQLWSSIDIEKGAHRE